MNKRTEFDDRKRELFKGNHLPNDLRPDYFRRLEQGYIKKNQEKHFILQYSNGDGNELNDKFWSIHSSSRFAFELYSWMAKDKRFIDFEFEKKLAGINGSPKRPNMDVYIEIDDRIIFIESKFSEKQPQRINGLSESYYLDNTERSKQTLLQRYYGDEVAAKAFSTFILDIVQTLNSENNKTKPCWMDYKQEITHLIGIYLYITRSNESFKDKRVEFLNVFYDFGDGDNNLIKDFFNNVNIMMNELLQDKVKSFKYEYWTAQELVKKEVIVPFSKETKAFASEQTIGELLEYYFDFTL